MELIAITGRVVFKGKDMKPSHLFFWKVKPCTKTGDSLMNSYEQALFSEMVALKPTWKETDEKASYRET